MTDHNSWESMYSTRARIQRFFYWWTIPIVVPTTNLPGVIAKENKFSMSSKGYYSNNFKVNVKPTKVIETLKMENNSKANVSSNFDKM